MAPEISFLASIISFTCTFLQHFLSYVEHYYFLFLGGTCNIVVCGLASCSVFEEHLSPSG
jgi:hypothetical protein